MATFAINADTGDPIAVPKSVGNKFQRILKVCGRGTELEEVGEVRDRDVGSFCMIKWHLVRGDDEQLQQYVLLE